MLKYQYIVRVKSDPAGRRWGVREAISVHAAYDAINHARVLGSVGQKDVRTLYDPSIPFHLQLSTTLADVVQLNSDNTERQPYTEAY